MGFIGRVINTNLQFCGTVSESTNYLNFLKSKDMLNFLYSFLTKRKDTECYPREEGALRIIYISQQHRFVKQIDLKHNVWIICWNVVTSLGIYVNFLSVNTVTRGLFWYELCRHFCEDCWHQSLYFSIFPFHDCNYILTKFMNICFQTQTRNHDGLF